jgi:hypothetical protein
MQVTPSIKWLCIVAWLLMLLLTAYYWAGLPKTFVIQQQDVSGEIWHRQSTIFIRIAIGLGLALISLPMKRWWPLAIIGSSLIYLVQWYFGGPLYRIGIVDGYHLLWQTALRFDLRSDFLVRDLVVPMAMSITTIGALLYLVKPMVRPEATAH